MKKSTILLLLSLTLWLSTANSETVTTDNLLSNSTFGTGTTYDSTGWTISSGTSGHGDTTIGGGNDPGGSVASTGNTNIEQTVSSIKTAAGMTVNEVRKGWSSTMSTDIWYWNSQNNTTTLKQTITDNDGNVSTQQRVISDTGCGGINCGQYTNYTDTHIQGSNTKDDFSIKVGVSNSNSLSGHYGPDIDDIQLKITYTDVPPIEEDTQEELDEITEDIDEVVEDIEDNIVWEDNFTFEEDYVWEEDFYFEEDFETTWDEYTMDFNDDVYFEEEFTEFEEEFDEVGMPEFEEFETAMMPEDSFEEMYMEEFEEFEDAFAMEEEETVFEEEIEMEEETVFEEEEVEETEVVEEEVMEETEIASNEEPEEMASNEEETTETEVTDESEETTEEDADDVEAEPESEESPQEVIEDEDGPDGEKDIAAGELEEKKVTTKTVAKIDVAKIKEIIVEEVKVDLFSNQEALQEYSEIAFYSPEQIYTDVDTSFFDQISMLEYNKEIYQNVRLASYMDNDPVEVHRKKMEEIIMKKRALMIELEQLKNE
jgi:hypothetical protein